MYKAWRYHFLQLRFIKHMDRYGIGLTSDQNDLKLKQICMSAMKLWYANMKKDRMLEMMRVEKAK